MKCTYTAGRESDMQAAAAILISLGSDRVNAGPVSSSQANPAGISFAQSFDESAAQIIDALPQMDGNEMSAGDVDLTTGVLINNVDATALLPGSDVKTEVGVGSRPANGTDKNKSFSELADAKVPTNALEKLKTKLTENGVPSTQGKLKVFTPAAIQMESTEAQTVSDPTEKPALDPASIIPAGKGADATNGQSTGSHADVSDLANSSAQLREEISSVQNQKPILIAGKKQDDFSVKTVRGHDAVVKTEEIGKKEKTEKISKSPGKKVEVQAQVATGIPVVALLPDGTQSGAIAPQMDDAQSSAASVIPNPRIGLVAGPEHKPGKKAVAQGASDADGSKLSNSFSPDELAVKKTSTEASKTGASPAIPDDKLNGKSQTPVVAIAAADLSHIGVGGVDSKSDHAAIARLHGAGDSMDPQDVHAGAGIPLGSSPTDPAMPLDVSLNTLRSTPTTLEVGVADGSRGWLKIRAEMADGGGVNASLSTASSSGQDILHKELPSLTAYLQSEHIAVNRLVVQPAPAPVSDLRAFAGGMNNDRREQSGQSGGQGGESRQNASGTVSSRLEQNRISGVSESRGDELFSSFRYSSGGGWLSVRA